MVKISLIFDGYRASGIPEAFLNIQNCLLVLKVNPIHGENMGCDFTLAKPFVPGSFLHQICITNYTQ